MAHAYLLMPGSGPARGRIVQPGRKQSRAEILRQPDLGTENSISGSLG